MYYVLLCIYDLWIEFGTAVARRLKPSRALKTRAWEARATAVLKSNLFDQPSSVRQ